MNEELRFTKSSTRSILAFYRRQKLAVRNKLKISEEERKVREARRDYKKVILNQDRRKSIFIEDGESIPIESQGTSIATGNEYSRQASNSSGSTSGRASISLNSGHTSRKRSRNRAISARRKSAGRHSTHLNESTSSRRQNSRPSTAHSTKHSENLNDSKSSRPSTASTSRARRGSFLFGELTAGVDSFSKDVEIRSDNSGTASIPFSRRNSIVGNLIGAHDTENLVDETELQVPLILHVDSHLNSDSNTINEYSNQNERSHSDPISSLGSRPSTAKLRGNNFSSVRMRRHSVSAVSYSRYNHENNGSINFHFENQKEVAPESIIQSEDGIRNTSPNSIISASISRRHSAHSLRPTSRSQPVTARNIKRTSVKRIDDKLETPYEGGPPSSIYNRSRIEMSHWKKRPRSAITKKKRITMTLYEKEAMKDKQLEEQNAHISVKIQSLENRGIAKELERRHIQRESFQFLENDPPNLAKETHNLSESTFLQLRDFIKQDELRNEIFKHDTFVPVSFPKTQLNLYRLGSHNNAYDSYDTLDYLADKNMYAHLDRLNEQASSRESRGRKSMTRQFFKSLPKELGVDKEFALKSRIRESFKR